MNETTDKQLTEKRPNFLKVLCILTFISSGLGIISTIFQLLFGPKSEEIMRIEKVALASQISEMKDLGIDLMVDMLDKIGNMSHQLNENFYLAHLIGLLTASLGLYSALKMWQGFKFGFKLYTLYSLLAVIGTYLYISPSNIPSFVIIFNLLFSALFIFLYSRNLHWMK